MISDVDFSFDGQSDGPEMSHTCQRRPVEIFVCEINVELSTRTPCSGARNKSVNNGIAANVVIRVGWHEEVVRGRVSGF